ncbi:MAG: protein-glutamate O-methyltransferase CheR [Candidatus Aminicenantes bacterium]|nr:protein-glutamate O-methyltransferase CheR [Candidatus Aminicenantes bacterium]NIM81713.1 protein-glutamate O-methyltransferase CheR [Candidatus Aminicenantes bacterium]NIN21084.1 protein-glutamate O-methyltransferase CheR [Candidatus Aminicenantes bacterium]NIN44906.1 protein-glutamate O-methyltransferase CheR [Candidatus Aminicenantes bacterium]NIN87720.1 protein-glutamate O-methyltransferase CheR [Candidatus Aminicenantes bacterium]
MSRDVEIEAVLAVLKEKKGIDLTGYRRETIKKRVSERITRYHMVDPGKYLELIQTDIHECEALLSEILIHASWFFRDPIVFEIIEQSLLPSIIAEKSKRPLKSREIRIWSVGCAAGEEPYSTAILVHQALERTNMNWKTYIFATDIDPGALERAKTGIYMRESFMSTKLGNLDRYFISKENSSMFEVRPFIKAMVFFSLEDCTSAKIMAPAESVFGTFDMVLCRNLLIYFSRELQKKVLSKLTKTILPGGYLILGESESLIGDVESEFLTVDSRNKIFQKILRNTTRK